MRIVDTDNPPAGWRRVRVRDALKLQNGRGFKASEWRTAGRPIIRIQNLKSPDARFNHFNGALPDKFAARPGDLLFAWSGTPGTSFGAHVWDGPEAWINQHIFRVDFSDKEFDRDFLKLALDANLGAYIEQAQGGVGLAHITKAKLNDSVLLAPPLLEQRLIAAALGTAEAKRQSSRAHLATAGRAIERFRQAVLADACSGRLTADWREAHDDDVQRLVEDLRHASAGRTKPVAEPDPNLVDDLPAGWEPVALDLLIDRIEAGKSVRAHGRPAYEDEWGVIKVSAMSWGRFLEAENKAIADDRLINSAYEIHRGDLLISRANTVDLVGATVLVDETSPRLLLSDKSLRLIPRSRIDKAWLNYTLRSQLVRSQFSERATGTSDSMRNLSQDKILSTTLSLPPREEQLEIARRVNQLLTVADALQRRVKAADRRVERSAQAILAKAFRGDLIAAVGAGGPER